jgi:hypothetical protein
MCNLTLGKTLFNQGHTVACNVGTSWRGTIVDAARDMERMIKEVAVFGPGVIMMFDQSMAEKSAGWGEGWGFRARLRKAAEEAYGAQTWPA